MAFVTAKAPTPVEDHRETLGLLVKRDDLAAPAGFPPSGKLRGIIAHLVSKRQQGLRHVGVLDVPTGQADLVVAAGLLVPDMTVHVYVTGAESADKDDRCRSLIEHGARVWKLSPMPAGVAHGGMKLDMGSHPAGGFVMPLRLDVRETVEQVAEEVVRTVEHADRDLYRKLTELPWLVAAATGFTAAGVCRGLETMFGKPPKVLIHGDWTNHGRAMRGLYEAGNLSKTTASLVTMPRRAPLLDELPFPCDPETGGRALRWWLASGRSRHTEAVFWNVGCGSS